MDREKVIKGLELCTKRFCDSDCPYYHRSPMIGGACITALQTDTLSLLKKQEEEIKEKNQRIWELLYERDADDGK